MATTLDREQLKTVRAIKREARQRYQGRRARRHFVNTAISVGLVEDNLHNSAVVRDHDSKNWRQERAVGYADDWARTGGPLNLRASVRRFANEYDQFLDPGDRPGDVAAEVQRPAAQYRSRYQERLAEANAIRKAVKLNGGAPPPGGRVPGGRGRAGAVPPRSGFDPGSPIDVMAAAQQEIPRQALVPQTALAAPAHSAQAVLPEGYQQVQGGGGGVPSRQAELPGAAGLSENFSPDLAPALPQDPREVRKRARAKYGLGGLNNAEGLADELSSWAKQELGIGGVMSRDRDRARNAAAGGADDSDHLEDVGVGEGREAVDLPTTAAQGGWAKYRQTVRKLGLKPASSGFTTGTIKVGDRRFRVQVIFGDAHDHGDHIHVGFRRIGR